jgi:hypothetical protein
MKPRVPGRNRNGNRGRWLAGVLGLGLVGLASVPPAWAHGLGHEEIQRLTTELEAAPHDPVRLERRLELRRIHGLIEEAWSDLERLERLTPGNLTNRLRRGSLELAVGSGEAAARSFAAWLAVHPEDLTARLGLAQALVRAGRPMEALPQFDRHLAGTERPAVESYLEAAQARKAAGASVDGTLALLDDGVRKLGPLPGLQELAASLEAGQGKTAAAVARFDTLVAGSGHPERWWFRQGELWQQAGRREEARQKFLAVRAALEALPPRQRRTLQATDLRQQVEAHLAGLEASGPVR